jgi:hypothetical protein
MFDAEILNDIEVTSKAPTQARVLPPPGNYTVQLNGVGPSVNQFGNLDREFGKPLFAIEELNIDGPFPHEGVYKLWQKLPMTDTKEYGGRLVNYLRDIVRAYDEEAVFESAVEAFELIEGFIDDGKTLNVRVMYYAEDFKGKAAELAAQGLKGVPFSQLTEDQRTLKNEIERGSKARGVKPFTNEDGSYSSTWTSPFGNVVPVRLSIARFFNSSYDPFTS